MDHSKRRRTPPPVAAPQPAGPYLGPGVWEDRAGALHVSVPELLAHFNIADTPANRDAVTRMMTEPRREQVPRATRIDHDDGTDG